MASRGIIFASACLCLHATIAAQELKLLPTAAIARQIRDLHTNLKGYTISSAARDSDFDQLEAQVSAFLIAQIEAEPKLEPEQLHDQLMLVLGAKPRDSEPAVLIQRWPESWGPRETGPVVWGVVYADFHHHGMDGGRTVVESYVVEGGRARLAERGGSEADGIDLHAYPISTAGRGLEVLVSGTLQWSSGHELPGKAALYSIDQTGVHLTWQIAKPGLRAFGHPDGEGFTVMYHDEDRHTAGNNLDSVIEVYLAGSGELRRIVSQWY